MVSRMVKPWKVKEFVRVCKKCGKRFVVKRHSIACVPSNCFECNAVKTLCMVCGRETIKGRKLCGSVPCKKEWARLKELKPHIIEGHRKQARSISGMNNPMAVAIHRRKQAVSAAKHNYKVDNGILVRSSLEQAVANVLIKAGVAFEYERALQINGVLMLPDFFVKGGKSSVVIEVMGWTWQKGRRSMYMEKIKRYLEYTDYELMIVVPSYAAKYFYGLDKIGRVHLIVMETRALTMVEVSAVTNLDYGHFLAEYDGKCRAFHSHSSASVGIKVWGYVGLDGMVVDFGTVKKFVKDAVDLVDHKVVVGWGDIPIKQRRVCYSSDNVRVKFLSSDGRKRAIDLPKDEVFFMEGRATLENILLILGQKVLDRLPRNVEAIALSAMEGVTNKAEVLLTVDNEIGSLDDLVKIVRFHMEFK
jgi:6-pyruvoyl-tetrahydropterin synthase